MYKKLNTSPFSCLIQFSKKSDPAVHFTKIYYVSFDFYWPKNLGRLEMGHLGHAVGAFDVTANQMIVDGAIDISNIIKRIISFGESSK